MERKKRSVRTPLPLVYSFSDKPACVLPFFSSIWQKNLMGVQVDDVVIAFEQIALAGLRDTTQVLQNLSCKYLYDKKLYFGLATFAHLNSIKQHQKAYEETMFLLRERGFCAEGIEDVFYLVGGDDAPEVMSGECVNLFSGCVCEADTYGYYKAFCELRQKPREIYHPIRLGK